MCRFVFYRGAPIRLSSLLTEPAHSIIHQSYHSKERAEPLNGDAGLEQSESLKPGTRRSQPLYRCAYPCGNAGYAGEPAQLPPLFVGPI